MKTNYMMCCQRYIYAAVALLFIAGCSKMNDLHDVYLRRGETLYVGKPDSVQVLPGRERVKLRYWVSDPKAEKLVVYWRSRTDSIVADIPPRSSTGDTLELIIDGLAENQHSFTLHTMNKNSQHRSVAQQAGGMVYGEQFQNGLLNRLISSGSLSGEGKLEITWLGAVEKGLGCDIRFTNTNGRDSVVFVPMDEEISEIGGVAADIRYRTLFLPEPTAIDTFYTDWELYMPTLEDRVDPVGFSRWNPVGIPYTQYSAAFSIERLWDDDPATRYLFSTVVGQPFSFTFDLGTVADLSRFRAFMEPGQLFTGQSVESFELWGAVTPDVTDDFGSGWHKLGAYRFTRPSEQGGSAEQDRAVGLAGEEFGVDAAVPPVRYIRFVVTKSWSNSAFVTLGDLRFWQQLTP